MKRRDTFGLPADHSWDRFLENDRGPGIGFYIWFAFCALLSVALIGVITWAIIELVQWVTTK